MIHSEHTEAMLATVLYTLSMLMMTLLFVCGSFHFVFGKL